MYRLLQATWHKISKIWTWYPLHKVFINHMQILAGRFLPTACVCNKDHRPFYFLVKVKDRDNESEIMKCNTLKAVLFSLSLTTSVLIILNKLVTSDKYSSFVKWAIHTIHTIILPLLLDSKKQNVKFWWLPPSWCKNICLTYMFIWVGHTTSTIHANVHSPW